MRKKEPGQRRPGNQCSGGRVYVVEAQFHTTGLSQFNDPFGDIHRNTLAAGLVVRHVSLRTADLRAKLTLRHVQALADLKDFIHAR